MSEPFHACTPVDGVPIYLYNDRTRQLLVSALVSGLRGGQHGSRHDALLAIADLFGIEVIFEVTDG